MSTHSQSDLMKLSVAVLKKKCKSLRISSQGGKREIIKRLLARNNSNHSTKQLLKTEEKKCEYEQKIIYDTDYDEKQASKIKIWCESITGESLGESTSAMFEIFTKGAYLCNLLNMIKSNKMDTIPVRKKNGDPTFYANAFILTCKRDFKLAKDERIEWTAQITKIHKLNTYNIIIKNISALSRKATQFGWKGICSQSMTENHYFRFYKYLKQGRKYLHSSNKIFLTLLESCGMSEILQNKILYAINGNNAWVPRHRFIKLMKYISLIQNGMINITQQFEKDFTYLVEYNFVDLDTISNNIQVYDYKLSIKEHRGRMNRMNSKAFTAFVLRAHEFINAETDLFAVYNLVNGEVVKLKDYRKKVVVYYQQKAWNYNPRKMYTVFPVYGILKWMPLMVKLPCNKSFKLSDKYIFNKLCNMSVPFIDNMEQRKIIYMIANDISVSVLIDKYTNTVRLFIPNDVKLLINEYTEINMMRVMPFELKAISNSFEWILSKSKEKLLLTSQLGFRCEWFADYSSKVQSCKNMKIYAYSKDAMLEKYDNIPYANNIISLMK